MLVCCLQAPAQATLSQLSYARYTLNQINQDPHFKPFADAVDAAVAAMLQDAAALAASTGAVLPTTTGSSGNSGCAYPDLPMSYDGSGAASRQTQQAAVAAAYAYYQPVLRELCEAALRYHLQVQGTAEGMFIFVPGEFLVASAVTAGAVSAARGANCIVHTYGKCGVAPS